MLSYLYQESGWAKMSGGEVQVQCGDRTVPIPLDVGACVRDFMMKAVESGEFTVPEDAIIMINGSKVEGDDPVNAACIITVFDPPDLDTEP